MCEITMNEMTDPGNIQGWYGSQKSPHCSQQSAQAYLQWQSKQQHMFDEKELYSSDITDTGQDMVELEGAWPQRDGIAFQKGGDQCCLLQNNV